MPTQQHLEHIRQDRQSIFAEAEIGSHPRSNPYPKLENEGSSDSAEAKSRLRVRIPSSGSVYPTLTELPGADKDHQPAPLTLTTKVERRESHQEDLSPESPGQSAGSVTSARRSTKRALSPPRSPSTDVSSPASDRSTLGLGPAQIRKPAMACMFCRGRKIACGQPSAESEDRTCK